MYSINIDLASAQIMPLRKTGDKPLSDYKRYSALVS